MYNQALGVCRGLAFWVMGWLLSGYVIAAVRGKGAYTIGYLPKAFAAFIAPLMDTGREVKSRLTEIRGGQALYLNYGMRIEVMI